MPGESGDYTVRIATTSNPELPNVVTLESDGTVSFALFRPHAQDVRVVGSFNDWSGHAHEMTRDDRGWWRITCRLPIGEHSFQYLVDGHEQVADFAAFGVFQNGYGAWESNVWIDPIAMSPTLRFVPRDSQEREPKQSMPTRRVA